MYVKFFFLTKLVSTIQGKKMYKEQGKSCTLVRYAFKEKN